MATIAEEKELRVSRIRIPEDGIFLPWLTRTQTEEPVIEVVRSDLPSLWPFENYQTRIKQEMNDIMENNTKQFQELLVIVQELNEPRRLSFPEAQTMRPVPVTPHNKRSRRVRARKKSSMGSSTEISRPTRVTRNSAQSSEEPSADMDDFSQEVNKRTQAKPKRSSKKPSFAKPKRATRSSARLQTTLFASLNDIPEIPDTEEGEYSTPTEPAPKKKTVTLKDPRSEPVTPVPTVVIDAPHETTETPKEKSAEIEQDSPTTPEPMGGAPKEKSGEIERDSLATPEPMEGANADGSPQEDDEGHSPVEVRQLISLHETLIEKQQQSVSQSLRKTSKDEDVTEVHASPVLENTESTDQLVSPKVVHRSMAEQIESCLKKNPAVTVAKLKRDEISIYMTVDSPQLPITLTFDVSDEEDIADSVDGYHLTENIPSADETSKTMAPELTCTPVGTAMNTVCRSNLRMRLSFDESNLDISVVPSCIAADKHVENNAELQPLPEESIESVEKEGDEHSVGNETISTASQASSSVCSSSAATIILESDICTNDDESQSLLSEAEQYPSPIVRRSTRHSKKRSVVSRLSAKKVLQSDKLAAKRPAKKARTSKKNVAVSSSIDDTESIQSDKESDSEKKKPKIVKPVIKPPRKLRTDKLHASASMARVVPRAGKRNLDVVGTPGPFSPAPPKSKHMRCASPLCQEKSKTKASLQRSRNTFLNRSTAASRVRRTPGCASPSTFSRTRAALLAGSPFIFTSQANICLSPVPRPANLTANVQSFIRRNTPQKVNYEEQLAAKKEQLEQKSKREEEAKRRKEEEKQKNILEKRRKQEARERKVAEQREKKEKEQREKQQMQVELWEKRVADADKGKVIRQKEETAKAKKLQKKQAEAEEIRRREEEERVKKLKDQEQEKKQRLLEQKLLREQEAAARKQSEQEKNLEKQRQERLKEDKEAEEAQKKVEEEKLKRVEVEKTKRKKTEQALKMKQQKLEKEEAERRRKLQEEIEKKNAEAARLEEERKEKDKEAQRRICEEAQRRQEEAIRRQEKEEARKRKLREAKAAAEEKESKRKQDEIAHTNEMRKKREEIRRQAEQRREEERTQREEEKRKREECKQLEEIKKLKEIQESNEKLRKLEDEHKKERDRLREINPNATMDKSLYRTPGPNTTYNMDPNDTHGSPQTYDITPQVKRVAVSTEENYNIDDLASGDSTDDDDSPRKVVPRWAKGGTLRSHLIKQYYSPPDMAWIFRDALDGNEIRLDRIFKSVKTRYFKRTSTGQWNSPIMPVGHMSFTEQSRGFDYSAS